MKFDSASVRKKAGACAFGALLVIGATANAQGHDQYYSGGQRRGYDRHGGNRGGILGRIFGGYNRDRGYDRHHREGGRRREQRERRRDDRDRDRNHGGYYYNDGGYYGNNNHGSDGGFYGNNQQYRRIRDHD